jgi:hypothetical protein
MGVSCLELMLAVGALGQSGLHLPRGTTGSWGWSWFDGLAQGGGAIRCGGVESVDGMPDKINALIRPKDGFAEDGGEDFGSVCVGMR